MVAGISSIPLNFAKNRDLSPTPQTLPDGTTTATNDQQGALNVLKTSSALANPNLGTGQKSSTVLGSYTYDSSLFPSAPTEQSQIISRIVENAVQRFSESQAQITDTYKQKSANITAVVNQWITVKANINNAKAAVDQGQKSIDTVSTTLIGLRGVISNAAKDPEFNAKAFNSGLSTINLQADRLGKALNLVGSINRNDFTRNKVEYRNNLGTGVSTLNGGYAGSDYRIQASDGTVWVPNLTAGTLAHFSELQGVAKTVTVTNGSQTIKLPESASYTNGVKLVSYNDQTKAITLEITINPSDPPTTVTGTLKQTGIGLMPAWFYDLSTAAGRQQAHKAVNEATAQLALAKATVQVAANTVSTDTKRADNALSELNSKTSKAQIEQLTALQELQTKYAQQVQAMQNNLSQLQSQQQNYLDMFASQIGSDPYLNITI